MFSLASRKFLAMRNIALYSVFSFRFFIPPGMFDGGDCCDTRSISDHAAPNGSESKVTMDFIYNNQCHLEGERLPHGKVHIF